MASFFALQQVVKKFKGDMAPPCMVGETITNERVYRRKLQQSQNAGVTGGRFWSLKLGKKHSLLA
jgi:hypothetical protein